MVGICRRLSGSPPKVESRCVKTLIAHLGHEAVGATRREESFASSKKKDDKRKGWGRN